ncbi:MAG TPA: PLP-dependent aminotransferase family protein [Phycisphaerae bacterium]|nr:PLP-dependent aminotransferase family protein [Phycisphaerae bacterium]
MTDRRATKTPLALSQRALRSTDQPISYLMAQAVTNPHVISLAAGFVDYETLPGEALAEAVARVLADPRGARISLQYGTTEGLKALRKRLLDHMAELDGATPEALGATIDDLIVATGSQELLFLITGVLVDPGDIVITSWPSYFVYTGTLQAAGARVRCVDMDDDGMIPEALERTLADIEAAGELGRVKIVYIVSYHQNPTGITLSAERRPRVLDVVRKYSRDHRILLLEDAAYRELTFEGDAPPSIKRFDDGNEFVATVQTFSKPFAPGLKTGYGLLPRDLVGPVLDQKGNIDFGSANICQHLLLEALESGAYERHVEKLRQAYAAKCGAMLDALASELGGRRGGEVRWTRPRGGLYVWLTLPEHIDTAGGGEFFRRCIAEGVMYVPGEYSYPRDETRERPTSTMRLSFGVASVEQIRQGVARLARGVRAFE